MCHTCMYESFQAFCLHMYSQSQKLMLILICRYLMLSQPENGQRREEKDIGERID